MTSYTPAQLAGILKSAGWPQQYIPLGVSIVEAESGGDTQSNLHTSRENSWGLFQINLLAHPEVSQECATDPVCSAQYAWGLTRNGTYFGDWTTYTEGRYLAFLGRLFPGWSYRQGAGGITVTAGQAYQSLGDWASTVGGPSASTGGIAQPSSGGGDLTSAVLSGLGLPNIANSDLIKGVAYFMAASMGFSLVVIGAYGIVTGKSNLRQTYTGFVGASFRQGKRAAKTAAKAAAV